LYHGVTLYTQEDKHIKKYISITTGTYFTNITTFNNKLYV